MAEVAGWSNLLISLDLDGALTPIGDQPIDPRRLSYRINAKKWDAPDEAHDLQVFGAHLVRTMKQRHLIDWDEADRVQRALHAVVL